MNILLIAIDTLRADHLGCYGWWRNTSPHLDEVAGRGVIFHEHVSPHIPTHPGYTTLFTGRDVFETQVVTQGGRVDLEADIPMLAEVMQRGGYFTAAADNLGRWFTRGYDLVQGYNWGTDVKQPWRKAEAVNEASWEVLKACTGQDKPWFAFLHYWDPHTPYLPPPPFDRMFYGGDETDARYDSAREMMREYPAFMHYFQEWMPGLTDVEFPKAQYDAEIAYVDTALRHVWEWLEGLPGGEDTAIIITSDHGEELDEHQMWFDHHGLYETNLHVPLILQHPERLSGGVELGGLTRHVDVAPTVLDLAGFGEAAEEAGMMGTSLLPLVDGESHDGTCEEVYITENAWMKKRGFRTVQYKFFESLYDEIHHRPPFELYDLGEDPEEQHNLAEERPELVAEFKRKLDGYIAGRMEGTGKPDPQSYQDITLRQVGNPRIAIPDNQVLEPEGEG